MDNQQAFNELSYTEVKVRDGLMLKMIELEEAETLAEVVQGCQEYIAQYMTWARGEYGTVQAEDFLKKSHKDRAGGVGYGFGVYVDGELAGHASFYSTRFENQPEIGYWIAQRHAGKGYTTEVTEALIDFGFNTMGVETIVLRARTDNPASQRVAEKCGFTLEKTYYDEEQEHETCLFRLNKKDHE